MKRSQRLQVVLRLYQQREDTAAGQVQTAQSQQQSQQAQLDQLVAYQQDYQRSILGGGNAPSVSIAQWRRLQDYIDQLGGIIRQQERQVSLANAELERARAHWQALHLERRSMESTIEAIARDEQLIASRQEQKQLDELIQQQRQRQDFSER